MTDEHKAKISAAMMGRVVSLETRAKLSATRIGCIASQETREKISAAARNPSPEMRAHMSAAQMGHKNALGYHHSEEAKAKISAAEFGHPVSEETRAKISASLMGNSNCLGHNHSEEAKEKDSMAHLGMKASSEARAKMSMSSAQRGKVGSLSNNWKGGSQVSNRKGKAKRRTLGFLPLNSAFVGCEGHHVNQDEVIHIPAVLHKSVKHDIWTGRNMEKINVIAYNYLFKEEIDRLFQVDK